MLLHDEVRLLCDVPLFEGLNSAKLKLLAFASDRVTFKPGEPLFRQGDAADAAYVILSGTAEILLEAEGGPVKVGQVAACEVVGEMAILSDKPRNRTVRATTLVETLRITKDSFLKLLAACPGSMQNMVRVLGERTIKVE